MNIFLIDCCCCIGPQTTGVFCFWLHFTVMPGYVFPYSCTVINLTYSC